MERRRLGHTGLEVSALGFGASGAWTSRLVTETAARRLIHQALDLGITYFDTGPSYAGGRAEARLGRSLEGVARDRFVISSKIGTLPIAGRRRLIKDWTGKGARRTVEASLRALRIERLDVVLLHGPSTDDITDDLLGELDRMGRDGLIGSIGLCGRGAELEAMLDSDRLDVLMAPLNAASSAIERTPIARAAARGLGIIAIEPLAGGRITGDRRRLRRPGDLWYLARDAIRGRSDPSVTWSLRDAFASVLKRPGVACALTTTIDPRHLEENASAVAAECLDDAPAAS